MTRKQWIRDQQYLHPSRNGVQIRFVPRERGQKQYPYPRWTERELAVVRVKLCKKGNDLDALPADLRIRENLPMP